MGKTKRGKGTKIMAVADRNGLPVSIYVDNAYDSGRLDAVLRF